MSIINCISQQSAIADKRDLHCYFIFASKLVGFRWLAEELHSFIDVVNVNLHGPNIHPPVNHRFFVCALLCTGLGALRAAATPRRGPDQEVNLKKISDCGGRMT